MTIEHMPENPQGVTGEPGPAAPVTGEPNVVVAPEASRSTWWDRVRGREPRPRVLVPPGEQTAQVEVAKQPSSSKSTESSVAGLTAEEVGLFSTNGISVADLQAAREEFGPEAFLEQARSRLEQFRTQQSQEVSLTPEQIAQKQAEERAEKIKQLQIEE